MLFPIRAPTQERNGGYIADRVVLEYTDADNTRFVWDNDDEVWFEFASSYPADIEIDLTFQAIDGQNWYAANVPSGVGAHTLIAKFFEQGAGLNNGEHFYQTVIPWDGSAVIDAAEQAEALEDVQEQLSSFSFALPAAGTLTDTSSPIIHLAIAQNTDLTFPIAFTNSDGQPVDLSGKTIKCRVGTLRGVAVFEVSCTVGGDDNNVVYIPVTAEDVPSVADYWYSLIDETVNRMIAEGAFTVGLCVPSP